MGNKTNKQTNKQTSSVAQVNIRYSTNLKNHKRCLKIPKSWQLKVLSKCQNILDFALWTYIVHVASSLIMLIAGEQKWARRQILRVVTFFNATYKLNMNILLDFQLVWLESELCTKRTSRSLVKSCLLHMCSLRPKDVHL